MRLGPYRDLHEVGQGGMGVVYRALDSRDGRVVALKTISGTAAADQRTRLALVREASATARLKHPNIVTVYEVGQEKGVLYLVMEYLEGAPLNRLIRPKNLLSMRRRLMAVIQLCDALDYAHQNGTVHRDVKPANIFILRDKSVKVVDFGIGALCEISTSDSARCAGTPFYMSPEQVNGAHVDGHSDIWSAGITLVELLTGKSPYSGPTLNLIFQQILHAPVPQVSLKWPFGQDLNRILTLALAKDRHARYSTPAAFAEDLRCLLPAVQAWQGFVDNIKIAGDQAEQATLDNIPYAFEEHLGPVSNNSIDETIAAGNPIRDASIGAADESRVEWPKGYARPALNLRHSPNGNIALTVLPKSKFQYYLKQFIIGTFKCFVILLSLIPLLMLFGFLRVSIPMFFVWSLIAIIGMLAMANAFERWKESTDHVFTRPRCRGCLLPMSKRSEWLNYPTSKLENDFAIRDCVGALKIGAWEDATKLFTILGAVYQGGKRLRHNLTFYECVACNEQVARLESFELLRPQRGLFEDLPWVQLPQYYEIRTGDGRKGYLNIFPRVRRRLRGSFWKSKKQNSDSAEPRHSS
jgi:serine/threonine protein kinase